MTEIAKDQSHLLNNLGTKNCYSNTSFVIFIIIIIAIVKIINILVECAVLNFFKRGCPIILAVLQDITCMACKVNY